MWKLQICKENENLYRDYIVTTPTQIYKDNVLIGYNINGTYYGSTTRIDEMGTIYFETTQVKHRIKLRVLDVNDNNLFEYQLSEYEFFI